MMTGVQASLLAMGPLLRPHCIVTAGTAAHMQEAVSQHIIPHRLRILRRGGARGELRCTGFGAVQIVYTRYDADVLIEPGPIDDCYLFDVPLSGCSWIRGPRLEAPITAGLTGISSVGQSVSYLQESGTELVTVKVARSALESHLARQLGVPPPRPLRFETSVALAETGGGRAWLTALETVLRQLHDAGGPLRNGWLCAETERWLLALLLHGLPHNYSGALPGAMSGPALPHYVASAERYIDERLPGRIDLAALIAATGVSRRTLFAGYSRHFGTSPMNHIRNRRLAGARAALLAADPVGASVTDIALTWGFGNLGNFAAAYRRAYGESPSATLRRPPV